MKGKIVLAEAMGYCWGVRRTLDIVQRATSSGDRIATIGDVIHNPQVVQSLREVGVHAAKSVQEASDSGYRHVAITAHGASPERSEQASSLDLTMIDTTCPLVTKVQRLAQKLVRQGYYIVVYGDAAHPEVRGILGWAGTSRAVAAKDLEELPWSAPRGQFGSADGHSPPRKVAVLSQTTKIVDGFLRFCQQLTELVAREGGEIRICNTICAPTTERQNAIEDLAGMTDLILVIGGRKSSNTARLAEVARRHGVPAHHVENEHQIDPAWFTGVTDIGVTAGASTPDFVINRVIEFLVESGYQRPVRFGWQGDLDLDQEPAY